MSNKLDNTRVVEFQEDYKIKGRSLPLYKKGSKHFIHQKTVEQLKEFGAKMKVSEYPAKKKIAEAKQKLEDNREKK